MRLRFAPSPTGHLHLGGLRTALFNHALARRHGGRFVLRIEDTDRRRLVPGAAEALEEVLEWAGLAPDESPARGGAHGPYTQSQRLGLYAEHAARLLGGPQPWAYRCFCSPERLAAVRPGYDGRCRGLGRDEAEERAARGEAHTVRLRVPRDEGVAVRDLVYGAVRFGGAVMDDAVLVKSDGLPTYHLASVVDDEAMGITHVLRGEEWLSSTPKHLLLYRALGLAPPEFAHLPLLVNPDGSKLSKRQDGLRVQSLRAQGFLPGAVVNFAAFLGWRSPGGQAEVFADAAAVATDFALAGVARSPAAVDLRKLRHLNRQHQLAMAPGSPALAAAVQAAAPVVRARHPGACVELLGDAYIGRVLLACCGSFDTVMGAVGCDYFWREPDHGGALSAAAAAGVRALVVVLQRGGDVDLGVALREAADEAGLGPGALLSAVRRALTGEGTGPEVASIIGVLGRERVLRRLCAALAV